GRDRHALDLLAVLADNQVLAPLADVGTGFLKVQDCPLVALREDAGNPDRRFLRRCQLLSAQAVEGFFGLADRCRRATKAAVAKFGGQRRGRSVLVRKLANGSDSLQSLRPEFVIERDFDPALAADVEEDAARNRHAEFLFKEETLGADLDGVVIPEGG